ncbi:MAG TPA: amidohydrolase family protein [Burkholderiales bacterium]|nr:amidohydrolase family protein [Burkholderiales bacterium]
MSAAADGIDIHAHGVPRQFLEEVKRTRLGKVDVAAADGGYVLTFPGCAPLRPAAGIMIDFTKRLGWLDGQGMSQQLIGPWLDVHGQELPPADGQEWVRQLNDAMAETVSGSARRLLAHATLHLADPQAAARELERCAGKLGMTGCMIPTNLPQGELSEIRYDALWEAAQSLDIPVVLHPLMDGPAACMFQHTPRFKNLYGRTIDTTIVATQLILAGVFDRFPRLRLVLVHGGGFLPYQTARLDREFGKNGKLPSDTVKRFYYDTVFMSAPALQLLFSLVGTGQVMIGSDYAAGPVERPGPKLTESLDAAGIDARARKMVVRDTAESLFRTAGAGKA